MEVVVIVVLLFLALGAGLSVLFSELSVGLKGERGWMLAGFMFFGYCAALLVGSSSKVTKHPQLYAVLLYWIIVGIGTAMNLNDKE